MAYQTMLSTTTRFPFFKHVLGREMRSGVDFSTIFAEESLVLKKQLQSMIAELEVLHECARVILAAKFERAAHRLSAKAVKNFLTRRNCVDSESHNSANSAHQICYTLQHSISSARGPRREP